MSGKAKKREVRRLTEKQFEYMGTHTLEQIKVKPIRYGGECTGYRWNGKRYDCLYDILATKGIV